MKLSKESLLKYINKENKLYYSTPQLNDCLYLNYKGIIDIEGLDDFVDLKVLYLEGNSIQKIQNLDTLSNLSSLYLHENKIINIENMQNLFKLNVLNLQDNLIQKIQNINEISNLECLYLKRNKIGINGPSDFQHLSQNLSLCTLDLSENKISDLEIIDVLKQMPNLKILYLQQNDVCEKIRNYRKTIIGNLKNLKYLDDRPVFPEERRFCDAFIMGGVEAERLERKKHKEELEQKHESDMIQVQNMLRQREAYLNEREQQNSDIDYQNSTENSKNLSTYNVFINIQTESENQSRDQNTNSQISEVDNIQQLEQISDTGSNYQQNYNLQNLDAID